MSTNAFQKRLRAIQKAAGLTVSDLAVALKAPYPTMRCWLVDGTEPKAIKDTALLRLERLADRYGDILLNLPERQRSRKLKSLLRNGK